MPLNAGDADCTTGLSKRIRDYWVADARNAFVSPLNTLAEDAIRATCFAIARAVVDEIQANATVTVTIGVADAGLQRDNTLGNPPTLAPTAPKTLGGVVG